jgi:hypothetical protein
MNTVRAKFRVDSITRRKGYNSGETQDIKLFPVHSGSEENKSFYAATPSGEITIGCANPDAAKLFELGKEYYIDFTPAA